LMRTGRQMAFDIKDGLWEFLEDIRQATVGEEGINGTVSRSMQTGQSTPRAVRRSGTGTTPTAKSQASKTRSSTKSGKSKTSIAGGHDESFWSEFGIDPPDQMTVKPETGHKGI